MADHEALVEVSIGRSSFKVSGTEAFIEKMIEVLPTLFPAPSDADDDDDDDDDDSNADGNNGKSGRGGTSLDDFMARYKITNVLTEVKKVTAFIFYLTVIKKEATCTRAQIEACFDESGLPTPNNLHTVINDATKPKNGYVRSVSKGNYATTTGGKNLMKELAA